jgi:hypothetical protein
VISFDNIIGAREQCRRQFETERLGGLEIDEQLNLCGLLDRQISQHKKGRRMTAQGQNPLLPRRNIDDRFTSINGHNVGEITCAADVRVWPLWSGGACALERAAHLLRGCQPHHGPDAQPNLLGYFPVAPTLGPHG